MKIRIDVDCTPQEARSFFGLPNLEPMQDALVEKTRARLEQYLDALEPEALMQAWLPSGLKGLGQLQEQFWGEFMRTMGGGGRSERAKRGKPPG